MNLLQLTQNAALQFGDPQYRQITEASWTVLANRAERMLAKETKSIVSEVDELVFVEGQRLYNTLTGGFFGVYDIVEVVRLMLAGRELLPRKEHQMIERGRDFRSADNGRPQFWYATANHSVAVYPAPGDSVDDLGPVAAQIAHYPTEEMEEPADVHQLPIAFEESLMLTMVYYATVTTRDHERSQYIHGLLRSSISSDMRSWNNRCIGKSNDEVDFIRFT